MSVPAPIHPPGRGVVGMYAHVCFAVKRESRASEEPEDCTEDVFLLACEACLAINIHYENRDTNQFMIALMAAEEVRVFVFAVVVQGLRF